MTRTILGGAAAVAALTVVVACFSEHGGTGPTGGSCTIGLDSAQYGSTIIAIQGFAFLPTPIHVRAGAKVTWLNCEPGGTPAHTTTSDAAVWDSNLLDPGSTYTFTFASTGTFAYHCTVHPSMTAQVIVDP
jgi:plastocyanin